MLCKLQCMLWHIYVHLLVTFMYFVKISSHIIQVFSQKYFSKILMKLPSQNIYSVHVSNKNSCFFHKHMANVRNAHVLQIFVMQYQYRHIRIILNSHCHTPAEQCSVTVDSMMNIKWLNTLKQTFSVHIKNYVMLVFTISILHHLLMF